MLSSAGLELVIYLIASVSATVIITRSYVFTRFWERVIPVPKEGSQGDGSKAMLFVTCPQCLGAWIGFGFWLFISWYRLGVIDPLDVLVYGLLNSIFSKAVGEVIG